MTYGRYIVERILRRYRDSSGELLRVMHKECAFMSHLSAARSLFFMREGFVFHEFSVHLFREVSYPSMELNNCRWTSPIPPGTTS